MLPAKKVPVNLDELERWLVNVTQDNLFDGAILSAEMFLYGGLIASRISNDTIETITNNWNTVKALQARYQFKLYLSNVVMRIPAYNGDMEEPWYWTEYGKSIYEYSYYTDKFNQLGNKSDLEKAKMYEKLIPKAALDKGFTTDLVNLLYKSGSPNKTSLFGVEKEIII